MPLEGEPRFVCDAMLGRLARWLRLLGYDTLYRRDDFDEALLEEARGGDRILLTRNKALHRRFRKDAILVRHDSLPEQISQVVKDMGLHRRGGILSRCSLCNARLRPASPERVEAEVPEYVRSRVRDFLSCPVCARVYWNGSHRRRMMSFLGDKGSVSWRGPSAGASHLRRR